MPLPTLALVEEARSVLNPLLYLNDPEAGVAWGSFVSAIAPLLEGSVADPRKTASDLVLQVLGKLLGRRDIDWETFNRPGKAGIHQIFLLDIIMTGIGLNSTIRGILK